MLGYLGLVSVETSGTVIHPRRLRLVALPPTLYLSAFVWENLMVPNPGPTRYIVLGLLLIVLMVVRPNGLLGERRVEII